MGRSPTHPASERHQPTRIPAHSPVGTIFCRPQLTADPSAGARSESRSQCDGSRPSALATEPFREGKGLVGVYFPSRGRPRLRTSPAATRGRTSIHHRSRSRGGRAVVRTRFAASHLVEVCWYDAMRRRSRRHLSLRARIAFALRRASKLRVCASRRGGLLVGRPLRA